MNQRIFITSFWLAFLVSCGPQQSRLITEKYGNEKPKVEKAYTIKGGDTIFTHEVHYHPNGQKKLEGALDNGLRDSTWTAWREDGKIWSQSTYRKGVEHGVAVAYHATGLKYYEGRFVDGKRVGIWRFYDETGREVNTQDFGKATPEK